MEALDEIKKVLTSEELSADAMVAEVGEILNNAPKRKKRDSRKLTWNERQYGAGFINGVWCGIAVGFPLAAGVAALCKVFVGWLMAW
jgi:hypothetical protein